MIDVQRRSRSPAALRSSQTRNSQIVSFSIRFPVGHGQIAIAFPVVGIRIASKFVAVTFKLFPLCDSSFRCRLPFHRFYVRSRSEITTHIIPKRAVYFIDNRSFCDIGKIPVICLSAFPKFLSEMR